MTIAHIFITFQIDWGKIKPLVCLRDEQEKTKALSLDEYVVKAAL